MAWSRYLARDPQLRDAGLACVGAGEKTTGPRDRVVERTLPCYALVIVSNGAGDFVDASGRHPVRAPAAFWLFPGVGHSYGPDGRGWSEHWMLFEGVTSRAYESYGAWDRSAPVVTLRHRPERELLDCFGELRRLTRSPSSTAQLLAATVMHRIIGLVRAATAPRIEDQSVIDRISGSVADNISVAERARRLGLSPAALRDEVRSATGLSVHELIIRARITRAQQLLKDSDLGVAEIGRMIGYEDAAYFSRLFSRRTGFSPIKFRELP
ncbi:helix-turn-helix domain-containing protein [Microlunatus elymi]|uniref:Helix-turn-helix domain-containing protein n=1 Tax=Microlunatus elymi TaxID=2596828 RepID=A0A516PX60_9ACTN|nr:helix-turn-helix domain-containing protein [Microlunatus elymi]QDP95770.1 helix-turn-helix domain-containing protein [Microlunatus elymi]